MTQFRDNDEQSRFEWEEDGILSVADYAERGGVRAILHVETPAASRGRGYAKHLMDAIVSHAREHKLRLRPVCGYAVAHFRRYPAARDVLSG